MNTQSLFFALVRILVMVQRDPMMLKIVLLNIHRNTTLTSGNLEILHTCGFF